MIDRALRRLGYEKRQSEYSDAITQQILSAATGGAAEVGSTAALEACAGLVGRGFASAKAKGARAEAVTPNCLMMAGRQLVRRGEAAFRIMAGPMGAMLLPVSRWYVQGGPDPRSWVYELTMAGPTEVVTYPNVPAADVIHVRINVDPERPWQGRSPATTASLAADLAAESAGALVDEAKGPRGSFLPRPQGDDTKLAGQIKGAKGAMLLTESMQASYGAGLPPPKGDYEQRRFGFDAPDALVRTLEMASDGLMAAVGISAAIFRAKDAASAVSSYRHFAHSVLGPLGRLVQLELREKLESPDLELDFADLRAADVTSRANAFRRLVESGIETERALAMSGLLGTDG